MNSQKEIPIYFSKKRQNLSQIVLLFISRKAKKKFIASTNENLLMNGTVRPSVRFCLFSSKLVLLPRLSHSLFVSVCVCAAGFSVELAVAVAIHSSSYVTHY